MSFFDESDIATSAPEQTAWITLPMRVRGCAEQLELECRWRLNAAAVAAGAEMAFRQLDDEARRAADLDLLARHVVINWRHAPARDGGAEAYSAEGCVQLLRKLRYLIVPRPDGEPEIPWSRFVEFIGDPKNFGAPLVDAEELGKP